MTHPSDTESARRQLIARFVEDVRIARQSGRHVDDQALIETHPHLMPELAAELEKLRRIEAAYRAAQTPKMSIPSADAPTEDLHIPPSLLDDLNRPAIQVPGYSMLREISRGGQAVVYLAIQLSTGRKVALKLMRDGPFASDRALTRFRREVQALAAINHPNIVTIIDTGKTADGSHFLTMNYIAGENLSDYMINRYKKDPADPGKLLRTFLKICDAVSAAHRLGIIHRDLKPSNIRIDERGEPHILDFGLARTALDHALPQPEHAVSITGEFLGSLPWSSPEQAEGDPEKIDVRTDVYSLGVILYQILTAGRFPYEVVGNIRDVLNNILNTTPTPPSKIVPISTIDKSPQTLPKHPFPAINETIERIVLKALAKKRDERYQSAGELGRDLAKYLAGQRPAARNAPAPAVSPTKRPLPIYLLIAALAVAVITLITFVLRSHASSHASDTATIPSQPQQAEVTPPPAVAPIPVEHPILPAPSLPAQTLAPAATTFHGNLAILFKGGTLDLFLNGRRLLQTTGDDLRTVPLTLSPGDTLLLRLNTSFYYRSVRCAFIADNRSSSFVIKSPDVLLSKASDPKEISSTNHRESLPVKTGPHDDRQQSIWQDASLPQTAEWLALPEPNITYDLTFAVPDVSH